MKNDERVARVPVPEKARSAFIDLDECWDGIILDLLPCEAEEATLP